MLSIIDLKITVIRLNYVLSGLGKNSEKNLLLSKLDRNFLNLVLLKI